jgi:hypothetical protein
MAVDQAQPYLVIVAFDLEVATGLSEIGEIERFKIGEYVLDEF